MAVPAPPRLPAVPAPPSRRLPAVPDHDGTRFCRGCQEFLPVSRFPAGQRVYACKQHVLERIYRARRLRLADPARKAAEKLWNQCYSDARELGLALRLRQADIAKLAGAAQALSAQTADGLAVLPEDITADISGANAELVSRRLRRELLALFRADGAAAAGAWAALLASARA